MIGGMGVGTEIVGNGGCVGNTNGVEVGVLQLTPWLPQGVGVGTTVGKAGVNVGTGVKVGV